MGPGRHFHAKLSLRWTWFEIWRVAWESNAPERLIPRIPRDIAELSVVGDNVAMRLTSRVPRGPWRLARPLPRGPWWSVAIGLLVFFGGIIASGLTGSPWPLAITVAGGILIGEAWGVRCPQCKRRLTRRQAPVQNGPAYRLFYECRSCEALWDAEMVIDPTSD